MVSWLMRLVLAWSMARSRAGDIRPALRLDAPDVTFVFPGTNSWSGTFQGRDAHQRWLERLTRVGIKTDLDEVAVGGWPWAMRAAIRGRSWWDTPAGERVYDNRFVIWARLRWGRVEELEVYEDTEKAQALDDYLEVNQLSGLAA